jgi:hypothetical protein
MTKSCLIDIFFYFLFLPVVSVVAAAPLCGTEKHINNVV